MRLDFNLVITSLLVSFVMGSSYPNSVDHDHPCGRAHDDYPFDWEIEQLVTKMTLREKVGQLTQIDVPNLINKETKELDPKLVDYYVNEMHVGSFLNSPTGAFNTPPYNPAQWVEMINQIQTAHQKNRLKIPMVFGLDSVHGAHYVYGATIFPQQLAQAATFNRTLVKKMAAITAKDTRAVGVHWNFSPILDIAVNKQWPRVYETFGEDPYVVSEMGRETVLGYQGCGNELASGTKVAATMKHFIGYSSTRSGKDVDGAWMSERIVNDYFRPSFQATVEAGVATAMESYSDIDGDHIVNSKQYLVDLLRKKMKFDGVLVTDYQQIQKLFEPIHVATSHEDAVFKVMKLGSCDMSMVPNDATFITLLEGLVKKGKIRENLLDGNVRRVLKLKKKLGLLGKTGMVDVNSPIVQSIGSPQDRQVSLDAARESIILLQNNNLLPLSKDKKVLITGPIADSISFQTGGWTFLWQGTSNDTWYQNNGTTIYQGLKKHSSKVTYMPSVDIKGNEVGGGISAMVEAAKDFDVAIVCVGESNYAELEGNINDMNLNYMQHNMVYGLISAKVPVIVVANQGRPRVLNANIESAGAVLANFLAGPYSGQAIADIIYGDVNPSGKLPLTYTNKVNDNTQNYYRRFNENNPWAIWPFGHGLSYTSFAYSGIRLSKASMSPREHIDVAVSVSNTGKRDGQETVLMFITDDFRTIAPEVKKLRGFEKIFLKAGETKEVKFSININDLKFVGLENKYIAEEGNFTIAISGQTTKFELKVPSGDTVYLGE